MIEPAARSASLWTRIGGVLLIADGALVALLGITFILLFRPVAAIQGRESVDQTPYGLVIVPILLALAYLWAGQRAIRGIRAGRAVGILLALLPGLAFGSLLVGARLSPTELAFALVVVAVQAVIIVALARWPVAAGQGERGDRHHSAGA